MSIKCSCNIWNPNDANYCRNCGAKLRREKKELNNKSISNDIQSSNNYSTPKEVVFGLSWGKILAILTIIVFIILAIPSFGTSLIPLGIAINNISKQWHSL